jgi:hypothetical protein
MSPTGKRLERAIISSSLPRLESRRDRQVKRLLDLLDAALEPDINAAEVRRVIIALVLWTILLAILFVEFSAGAKMLD